ncbi:hypothetical protein MMC25_005608 [Agyrium rufum]|nr:hypothetical protein [Agyrium rufum]
MFFSTLFTTVTALIAVSNAAPLRQKRSPQASAQALYFMTNNPEGNQVYTVKVGSNGTLSDGSVFSTGGLGGSIVNPGTTTPAQRDGLSSSHSVYVFNDTLLTLNAGSNTISMFNIDSTDPTQLTLVGEPTDVIGDFPVSIAYSSAINQVCIANTGARSGISCFGLTPAGLSGGNWLPYQLNQTTPATNALGMNKTITRALYTSIEFTEDQSTLIATVTSGDASSGYMIALPVEGGAVTNNYVKKYVDPSTAFFVAFTMPGTDIMFALDGRTGSYFLNQTIDEFAKEQGSNVEVPDSGATCWATLNPTSDTIFLSDASVNRFVEVSATDGSIINTYNATNPKPGMLDLVSSGFQTFGLSPGVQNFTLSITVLDASRGAGQARIMQDFEPANIGVDKTGQGMAAWPASGSGSQ